MIGLSLISFQFLVEGTNWGESWKELQNGYFKDKKSDLKVDLTGIVSQKHLGPKRLRTNWKKLRTFVSDYYHKDGELFESRVKENVIGKFNVVPVESRPKEMKLSDHLQKVALQVSKETGRERASSLNNFFTES